jgi:hypothetical protein
MVAPVGVISTRSDQIGSFEESSVATRQRPFVRVAIRSSSCALRASVNATAARPLGATAAAVVSASPLGEETVTAVGRWRAALRRTRTRARRPSKRNQAMTAGRP